MSDTVTQIFSFGYGHAHQNRYIKIKAPSKEAARAAMFSLYGKDWGFQYDEDMEPKLIEADMHYLKTLVVGNEHLAKAKHKEADDD